MASVNLRQILKRINIELEIIWANCETGKKMGVSSSAFLTVIFGILDNLII